MLPIRHELLISYKSRRAVATVFDRCLLGHQNTTEPHLATFHVLESFVRFAQRELLNHTVDVADLKLYVAKQLNKLLQPVRDAFASDEMQMLIKQAYPIDEANEHHELGRSQLSDLHAISQTVA